MAKTNIPHFTYQLPRPAIVCLICEKEVPLTKPNQKPSHKYYCFLLRFWLYLFGE